MDHQKLQIQLKIQITRLLHVSQPLRQLGWLLSFNQPRESAPIPPLLVKKQSLQSARGYVFIFLVGATHSHPRLMFSSQLNPPKHMFDDEDLLLNALQKEYKTSKGKLDFDGAYTMPDRAGLLWVSY
jgi:hypothetical protein